MHVKLMLPHRRGGDSVELQELHPLRALEDRGLVVCEGGSGTVTTHKHGHHR